MGNIRMPLKYCFLSFYFFLLVYLGIPKYLSLQQIERYLFINKIIILLEICELQVYIYNCF